MNKYECTVIFDASASVTIEADNPEDAAIKAEDELQGRQHLCHHCSDKLETGDSLGVHVYNEDSTEQLLDTTYSPPQRQTLTDEQIDFLNFLYGAGEWDGVWFEGKHPTKRGAFWWRKDMKRLFDYVIKGEA